MTGPAAGDPDVGAGAPAGLPATRVPIGAILPLLALGLALRLLILYALPGSGFGVDLQAFRYWAADLAQHGPFGFYDRGFFADYTPGYLYLLWVVGIAGRFLGGVGDLIKIPAILADLAVAWLIADLARELGATRRRALAAAALFLFFPITWFDSAVWGQVDSIGIVFLLLGVRAMWRERPYSAAVWATVAAVVKPQLGILVFILAGWLIGRYIVERGREAVSEGARTIALSALVAIATATALSAPFGLTIVGLLSRVASTAGGYPYLSVNAYNPWALVSLEGTGIAANGAWVRDVSDAGQPFVSFGPIPAVAIGTGLILVAILALVAVVARRPDRATVLVALTALAIAFFVLPTRVHERYLYPFVALGLVLGAISRRWWVPWLVLSSATFLGMYVVLTTLYPGNPQVSDWLGIGPAIRSTLGVALIAIAHAAGLVWAAFELRRRRLDALERTIVSGVDAQTSADANAAPSLGGRARPAAGALLGPTLPAASSGALAVPAATAVATRAGRVPTGLLELRSIFGRPDPDDPSVLAWIRRRIFVRPVRADRSEELGAEGGGRFDGLDAWIVVVMAVAILALRMFRLDLPYQMHFDEVYHARTATEFLQDWRYGEPHSIYEFTHPHLAKYAMAAGLVAFADDRVTGTSELQVPVTAATTEARWDDPRLPNARAGDRLYIATGSEVRAIDLETRRLVATVPVAGATTIAVAEARHEVFIGTSDGTIVALDTTLLDGLRVGGPAPSASNLRAVTKLDAPVTHIFATPDGAYLEAAVGTDRVVSLSPDGGAPLGSLSIRGVSGFADGGSADSLVAHPSLVPDPSAAAQLLANLLGGSVAQYRDQLAKGTDPIVMGATPGKDARASVDAAIADGRLAGFEFATLPRVAVGTATGVTLVSPTNGAIVDTVSLAQPVTGLAVTTGLDNPYLYVAVGRDLVVITLPKSGGDVGTARTTSTLKMPGDIRDVTWDPSSLMIHVLGRTADGSAATIYVVEPHAVDVYSDARLPFEPAAWATDVSPRYPNDERQEILAFSPSGTAAAVDIGKHAYAWRVPGVLAGVLTSLLLYFLARILFRRRLIAVLAALFTAFDGMMFVQSRIGMNDVYVGLFIVAAYAVFAGLWTGRWRSGRAFWLLMPVVGVLVGLAMASKWVGLYALAGLGVLVLVRSALGRLILVVALVGATAVLGYMGMSVPEGGTSGGNLTFMLLMISVTLVAVVVSVLRPIEWTLDEVRFAVGAPAAFGILVLLIGIPVGVAGTGSCSGSGICTSRLILEGAFGLIALGAVAAFVFWGLARAGWGPLAPPDRIAARRLPAASPAPVGWLRPGWSFGLPVAWLVVCLGLIPLAVYVASYLPWIALGNRLTENWPPGNTGQTLAELTASMYRYHNDLRAPHAASSPWWAWPLDLKPVWFYQGTFNTGTAGAIYNAGNLVLWWLSIPAMAFISWQAYRRRNLALTVIAMAFFWQWLPWARIDRATFQYHYYTGVPFLLLALAYLVAELWHGPSARTWLLARVAAAVAIVGPMLLWILRLPLCGWVRVDAVNAGSQACVVTPPGQIVLTLRTAGLVAALGLAVVVIVWQVLRLDRSGGFEVEPAEAERDVVRLALSGAFAAILIVVLDRLLPETRLLTIDGFAPEAVALGLLVPLGILAWFVLTARDARRFVAGVVFAGFAWFVVWYPNITGLAVPTSFVNSYQGLLPTYLYPFQFPVNTDPAGPLPKFLTLDFAILVAALVVTVVVVAFSATTWRAPQQAFDAPDAEAAGPVP